MKTKIIQILTLLFFFSSCKENLIESIPNDSLNVLSGKIKDYNLGSGVIMKMELNYKILQSGQPDSIVIIDSVEIKSDGSFYFAINEPPSILLGQQNGLLCSGLVFSDTTIKTYPHSNFILYKNGQKLGWANCSENPLKDFNVGEYFSYLMFSEKELTVKGNCIGQSGSKENTVKYNLELKADWNLVITKIIQNSDSLLLSESYVNNNKKVVWLFQNSN